jgi:translation elongation factor EF-1alpha
MGRKRNVVVGVVGQKGAGKTTTIVQLLLLSGCVDKRSFEKFYKETLLEQSENLYAHLLEKLCRDHDASGLRFHFLILSIETATKRVGFIESFELVPLASVINDEPTFIAQHYLFVLSLENGNLDLSDESETKLHLQILHAQRVRNLIIVLNKFDLLPENEAESHFRFVQERIKILLWELGFDAEFIPIIPISAKNETNLQDRSNLLWWKGPTLMEILDSLEPPVTPQLRVSVEDIYQTETGTVVSGKILSGIICPDMRVEFIPSGIVSQVRSTNGSVGILLVDHFNDIARGELCIAKSDREIVPRSGKFVALVRIENFTDVFCEGKQVTVSCGTREAVCTIVKIVCKYNKSRTPGTFEMNPTFVEVNDRVIAEFFPVSEYFVVEPYHVCLALAQIQIRQNDSLIAGDGLVLEIIPVSLKSAQLNINS